MTTDGGAEPKLAEDVLAEGQTRMDKAIEALKRELTSVRTGRATPSLIEHLSVEYYGTPTPLSQLATITAPEARSLTVQPWDKQALREIEKSLQKSDLGLNPSNDGSLIRIPIPPLSQERRREMVKVLKQKAENGKLSVRNIRRDAIEQLRSMEKNKNLSQDENHRAQDRLQKYTDQHIADIDQISSAKEAEVMQV
jgi:ribosome recycling factor